MKTYISSRTPALSQDSFLVCDHTFCTCVGEPMQFVYLRESEMHGLPILKLTGPFGSNHQMCHGKMVTSWCKGQQDFASINIFPQGWQWKSYLLGLCSCSGFSQQFNRSFYLRVCNKKWNRLSVFSPAHTCVIKSVARSTIGDKREEEFYLCHLLQIGSSGN